MKEHSQKSAWFNYAIALTLGVAFSITLLVITWNNSLESEKSEFALSSSTIKDTLGSKVQTANDTLNSLAAFLEASSSLNEQQYNLITSSLLELHPYIEGAVFSTLETGSSSRFGIRYQTMRPNIPSGPQDELLGIDTHVSAIASLFNGKSVIALDSEYAINGWRAYWILKAVYPQNNTPYGMQTPRGFIALLVNTSQLIGENIDDLNLSVMLLGDTAGLSGRQFLYRQAAARMNGWMVAELVEEDNTQFPLYSIRLVIMKPVAWNEIDKSLLYISLLIGTGVSLFLIAVVKTRDEQERQLRERNAVIEAQVREQTIELAHTRDQALPASLMKSSFLASMSHEIRTPLNAIIGMSDLLAETTLDFEQKKYVSVFKKAGDTLLSLVNDILDLSKIEANQLKLEEIEFNLVDTIEESVEIYALKAAEKRIELVCNIEPSLKPVRIGDPSRLRQILLNLISNALKFTEKGEIIISARYCPRIGDTSPAPGCLEISVSDTGTGIPPDKLEAIFASFTQADSSTTRKYGGTGLGLTISRRLVEMMGGKIWAESTLGKGSRFIVQVEIGIVETHHDNVLQQEGSLTGMKILLVDDNQSYREVLKSYVTYLGVAVTDLPDAASAIACLENNVNGPYDLILADCELPGIDGFTLAGKIREINKTIAVILMLSPAALNQKNLAQLDDRQKYLTRPVKKKELMRQIAALLSQEDRRKSLVTPLQQESAVKSLRILLVDDNPDNRLLVNAYLKKLPYVIEEAENGEQAVNMFTARPYDIVLMDVQMPVMDGREATRKIRQWEHQYEKTAIPIIALTAHAIKEEIDLCIEAGCNAHLSKPVKKATLVTTIQSFVGV